MADWKIKRNSTSVRLRTPAKATNNTLADSVSEFTGGSAKVLVWMDGDAAPIIYDGGGGEIDAVVALGTYAAPAANHCNIGIYAGTGVFELQLADAIYANAARGFVVTLFDSANAMYAHYTVALSNVDVENGEADLVKIEGSATIDGITITKWFVNFLAWMVGKVSKSDAAGIRTLTFKKQDGSTTAFTVPCSTTDGTRATTGTIT